MTGDVLPKLKSVNVHGYLRWGGRVGTILYQYCVSKPIGIITLSSFLTACRRKAMIRRDLRNDNRQTIMNKCLISSKDSRHRPFHPDLPSSLLPSRAALALWLPFSTLYAITILSYCMRAIRVVVVYHRCVAVVVVIAIILRKSTQ